ncbi:MAG TPA: undecaprenyl-diphosphate phosphatase [Spirochaetota bacterium]|nr:undecaprenyl-diphosphate phosphatase [Spirochaetota bacterium]
MEITVVLFVLAVIQGIAEFLPVSSSGHLVLFENIEFFHTTIHAMGDGLLLYINVMLHVATLVAIFIFLRKDLVKLVTGALRALGARNFSDPDFRSAMYIVLASVPAGVIGVLLHDVIESLFSSPVIVFFMLILNGFILLSTKIITVKNRQIEEMGMMRALIIGLFQAIAIIPGISRSGMTITGGFLLGVEPEQSARFSFLMAIPVILGAGLLESLKMLGKGVPSGFVLPMAGAVLVAIVVALLSLKLLFVMVRRIRIDVFGYYTILVGAAGLAAVYFFS